MSRLRATLLQVRDADDPMLEHEVGCFARALGVAPGELRVHDLLNEPLGEAVVDRTDLFMLGGSGDYSAASEGDWLERALDSLRRLHAARKPTFASCWGFQAMARAMGGRVVHDLERAEVGTHRLRLTEEGSVDPVFSYLGEQFAAQMGHEDRVAELPPGTTLLASSERVENQAYRFEDAPVYCTQFHPELSGHDLALRFARYPRYVERVARMPPERFARTIEDTPEVAGLVARFVAHVLPGR